METIIVTSESDLRRLIQQVVREELTSLAPVLQPPSTVVDEGLMTRAEMAGYLKISLVTLRDWVKRGLPCIQKGGRVLFQKSEVLEAIKGHQPRPGSHPKGNSDGSAAKNRKG